MISCSFWLIPADCPEKNMKSETDFINNSNIPKLIFIVLLLFSIHFWDLKFIPQKYNVENLITWLVCGYSFFMVSQKSNMQFKNAIFLFLIGLIFNSFSAYINLGQSPYKTLLSFGFYYFILLYFLLHYFKLSRAFLENIIIIFAIIYSVLYIYQYSVYPNIIFKNDTKTAVLSLQFAILGHGFLMLAYFLILNRYLLKPKLKNILMASGLLIVLLLCDFRTLIAGAILVTLIMFIKVGQFNAKKIFRLIFITLFVVGLFQFRGVSKIFKESVVLTQQNLAEGNKYIRLVELEFFFKKYPENISYFFLGGGKPTGANLYNFNPRAIGMNYNIVWVDLGLLGFYIVIGAVAVSGLLWYIIKAILIKLPKDRLYLNYYFLYLLIVSITNEEIYRNGIFTVQAIGLYLIDNALNEKSKSENEATVNDITD